jgi:hypothetical protein
MTSPSSSAALDAVERILNRGGDPEEVLRQVVETLQKRTGARVGITLDAAPEDTQTHDIVRDGRRVGTLWAGKNADEALIARVAVLISPYCCPD